MLRCGIAAEQNWLLIAVWALLPRCKAINGFLYDFEFICIYNFIYLGHMIYRSSLKGSEQFTV